MTEPDEALIWARERAKADWLECDDEVGGLHAAAEDFPSGDSDHFEDIEWRAEAYRAGQAASAERIKALEAFLRHLRQWDQMNPPMTGDHAAHAASIDALLKEADR
jgi:hypothetical protein